MERARDRIARLAGQGLDLPSFWHEAGTALTKAVPHHLTPCWFTLDPASLLVTSHYDHGMIPELPQEWLAHEYYGDDVNNLAEVAGSARGVSTLAAATEGHPERSRRWRQFVRPFGGDQELLIALRTKAGEAWGVLALYRGAGQPEFDADEIRFLRDVSPSLADGARRGLLVTEATEPDGVDSPGLVVMRDDWTVESMTPGIERLLAELPGGDPEPDRRLPAAVLAVAGRALRSVDRDEPGEVAMARVLSQAGRWVVLHGASLVATGSRRVAVIVEPAHPARISSLLMSAYGLTEREQEVTGLVLRGHSTMEIAADLVVSPHTVQEHLKNVFHKTRVRSRRELVGTIFFAHYEPRVRDNERRVADGRPLRGGPSTQGEARTAAPSEPNRDRIGGPRD
jgi:DNA-binding CsgD family transcriptional regulator